MEFRACGADNLSIQFKEHVSISQLIYGLWCCRLIGYVEDVLAGELQG